MTHKDTGDANENGETANSQTLKARRRAPAATKAPPSRALVAVPILRTERKTPAGHSPVNRLIEARGLAEAIELDIVDAILVPVATPRPSTLLGSGKVEELKAIIDEQMIGLVIVDHAISPAQQRNLEKAWNAKVIDRTGLILEIFGARARTREGVLQVELAHLTYQKGRLVRAWTHLERQRGGGGFLGGPGEAQIELDRRMLQDRIDAIKRELADVAKTRALHRKGRRKIPYPVVAIVGYTNAGKSTLFNAVTGAGVLAMDQVFATLDPTLREVKLKSGRKIILSDTVGFISDLPTMLVAAFRATLEEVVEADLILHVRDIVHEESDAQARDVAKVLEELGIDALSAATPILEVWNKADLLSDVRSAELQREARRIDRPPVLVSALTGEGMAQLLDAIDAQLGVQDAILNVVVPGHEGALIAWLYESAEVISREVSDDGELHLRVRVPSEKKDRLLAHLRRQGIDV